MLLEHAMTIQPRKLILGLLLAAKGQSVSAKDLVAACELFGVAQGSTRVALARLTAEQEIESTARGIYTLGRATKGIGARVSNWTLQMQRARPWTGFYTVAYTNHMGRTNRTILKQRETAFELCGFRELEQGLFIRPDNVEKDLDTLKARLVNMGVAPDCHLFVAKEFQTHTLQDIQNLWDPAQLNASYKKETDTLKQWLDRHETLGLEVAAKESYLLGSHHIRLVRHDPLLPDEWVDAQSRATYFKTVEQLDTIGQNIWRQFHEQVIGVQSETLDENLPR